jgi:hypothetical protein
MDPLTIKAGSVLLVMALLLGGAGCAGSDDGAPALDADTEPGDAPDEAPTEPATETGGGSEDTASSSSWSGDPCSLLTVAEIETQFGDRGPVAEGVTYINDQTCRWVIGDLLDGGGNVVVEVVVDSDRSLEDDARAAAVTERIEGLGDEAYGDEDSPHLLFRTDDLRFRLTADFVGDDSGALNQLIPLAELVLSRT